MVLVIDIIMPLDKDYLCNKTYLEVTKKPPSKPNLDHDKPKRAKSMTSTGTVALDPFFVYFTL